MSPILQQFKKYLFTLRSVLCSKVELKFKIKIYNFLRIICGECFRFAYLRINCGCVWANQDSSYRNFFVNMKDLLQECIAPYCSRLWNPHILCNIWRRIWSFLYRKQNNTLPNLLDEKIIRDENSINQEMKIICCWYQNWKPALILRDLCFYKTKLKTYVCGHWGRGSHSN